jgi:DNA-binding CsgD family transcriptional regulator
MTTQLEPTWHNTNRRTSPLSSLTPNRAPNEVHPHSGGRRTFTAHLDTAMRILAAEPDFALQFGRTPADTCGHDLYDLLHPSSPSVLNRHFTRLLEGRSTRFGERVVGLSSSRRAFSAELMGISVHNTAGQISGIIVQLRPDSTPDAEAEEGGFTPRERLLSKLDAQVLEGVASGASTVQLAARLYLSRQGVEYHIGIMLRKLKTPNRAALVARAHSLGMLTVGQWPPRVVPEFIK